MGQIRIAVDRNRYCRLACLGSPEKVRLRQSQSKLASWTGLIGNSVTRNYRPSSFSLSLAHPFRAAGRLAKARLEIHRTVPIEFHLPRYTLDRKSVGEG